METPLETGFCSSSFEAGDEFGWSMVNAAIGA